MTIEQRYALARWMARITKLAVEIERHEAGYEAACRMEGYLVRDAKIVVAASDKEGSQE